jgi:hypothetical protein
MDDGGKLTRRLKAGLKQRGAGEKKKRARLVLTNCFGICPKNAVVTGSAATIARGQFILIRDCSEERSSRRLRCFAEARVIRLRHRLT